MKRVVGVPLVALVLFVATTAAADMRAAYVEAFLDRIDHRGLPLKRFPNGQNLHLASAKATPAAALGEAMGTLLGDNASLATECLAKIEITAIEPCKAGVAGCTTDDERRFVDRGVLVQFRGPYGVETNFRSAFDDTSEVRTFFETTEYVDLAVGGVRSKLIACLDERLPIEVRGLVVPTTIYRARVATFTSRRRAVNMDFALRGYASIEAVAPRWSSRVEGRAQAEAAWRIVDRPPPIRRSLRASLAPYLYGVVNVEDLPGRSWEWRATTPALVKEVSRLELHRGGQRVASCEHRCLDSRETKCTGLHQLVCGAIPIGASDAPNVEWSMTGQDQTGEAIEWKGLPIRVTPQKARLDSCTFTREPDKKEGRVTCTVASAPLGKNVTVSVFDGRSPEGAPLATAKPGLWDRAQTVTIPLTPPAGMTDAIVTLAIEPNAIVHTYPITLAPPPPPAPPSGDAGAPK